MGIMSKKLKKQLRLHFLVKDKPTAIVLDTIKGKGVKEFENLASNHHMRFSELEHKILDRVILELEADIND